MLWKSFPENPSVSDAGRDGYSNILAADYVKPRTCAECHEEQHLQWSDNPHAVMNATASEETVLADFDGASIDYQGGRVTMFSRDDERWMATEKDGVDREYRITRTIGSRFFQFYVGVLEAGNQLPSLPAPEGMEYPPNELVLPICYWITKEKWCPAYDVFQFVDNESPCEFDTYDNYQPVDYYENCGRCHTTMPEGFRMLQDQFALGLPKQPAHFALHEFLEENAEEFGLTSTHNPSIDEEGYLEMGYAIRKCYDPENAVTLGISCESCHYGGREHAESKGKVPPRFTASSEHFLRPGRKADDLGRTAHNINEGCARCHGVIRNMLPGGELHKNAGESRDAILGSCYSQLACTGCHSPHEKTGTYWAKTPAQDDQSCIRCHEQYSTEKQIAAHTHHPVGSIGSNCMNCHMPKVTEGLQDIVRTHRIDSPTREKLLNSGGLNACNLCHMDESIEWTAGILEQWYGKSYDRTELASGNRSLTAPVAETWFSSEDEHVRMSALGAVKRSGAKKYNAFLLQELDSTYLIHRQFAQDTVESIYSCDLEEETGYRFWMTEPERDGVLPAVAEYLKADGVVASAK